jgi:hypothetical protein
LDFDFGLDVLWGGRGFEDFRLDVPGLDRFLDVDSWISDFCARAKVPKSIFASSRS